MANELQQAADACGHLAKQYKSVLALAEAVGKIGSIESHRNELERQRDKAKEELDAVMASLATAKSVAELEKAKKAAQAELERANFDLKNSRAALLNVNNDRAAAEDSVKALKAEAGDVEKRLAEMRADLAALKERFAQ